MAQMRELREAISSIESHPSPIFSGYLNVNAALSENQERAYLTRLRNALDEHGAPHDLALRVREQVENESFPGAGTLAIFAAEDGLLEVYRVQMDMPESFRWGEPYTAPLILALDEQEPYGAVVVDAERFRYYVVSLLEGAEEEGGNAGFREAALTPDTPEPRDKSDRDEQSRRAEAGLREFFNEISGIIRDVTFREGVRRLILAGPRERTSELRDQLPGDVKDRVVGEVPVDMGAPEGEILQKLEAYREEAEHERAGELLNEIRESGISGLDDVLPALQIENRIHHLALLWELEGEIRWSDEEQLAILDITQEESPYTGAPTRVRPLTDVIMDLAASRGARVMILRGEHENTDTLRDEFGGIAGLTRY